MKLPQILLTATLTLVWLPAQEPSSHFASRAKGFDPDGVFQMGQTDTVNLLNGNLSLSIPLGPVFKVGGSLEYNLSLYYNSNGWDMDQLCCKITSNDNPNVIFDAPWPGREANAGMGWTLSLGRLFQPDQRFFNRFHGAWVYADAAGTRHTFFEKLHPGTPQTPDETIGYTNDGSYIRLVHHSLTVKLVQFPNGTVHRFEDKGLPGFPDWRPVAMTDPFGNWVEVEYLDREWQIRDSIGRQQRVLFANTPVPMGVDPNLVADPVTPYKEIEKVMVGAFGQEDPTVPMAEYDFQYQTVSIERHRQQQLNGAIGCNSDYSDDCRYFQKEYDHLTQEVTFLTGLTFPDDRLGFAMDYYHQDDMGTATAIGAKSGALRSFKIPTGAVFFWEYNWDLFQYPEHHYNPSLGSVDNIDLAKLWNGAGKRNAGVVSKRIYANDNLIPENLLGEWRYQRDQPDSLSGNEAPNDNHPNVFIPCFKTVTVTDPEGNQTVHFFSNANTGSGIDRFLPYTKCDPVNGGWIDGSTDPNSEPSGPFLSKILYDSAGAKLREEWVQFEMDAQGAYHERERRQVLSSTYFFDDLNDDNSPRFVQVTNEQFDGLGNFRLKKQDSDFSQGRNQRSTFTNYNPGSGNLGPGGYEPIIIPGPDDPWILGTYDRIDRVEGPLSNPAHQASEVYCFDAATGFLKGVRRFSGPGGDVLTRYIPTGPANDPAQSGGIQNGYGNVYEEHYFGGDNGGLSPGGACTSPASDPPFVVRHRYQHGARSRSDYLDCDGSIFLNTLDVDIDHASGLIAVSRDPAGVATENNYDIMNRMVRVATPGSASIHYDYPTNPIRAVTRTCPEGAAGCSNPTMFSRELYQYDSLGRVVTQERTTPSPTGPGTVSAVRHIEYRNAMGWVEAEQRWRLPGEPPQITQYQNYDAFGRVGLILGPAGQQTTAEYAGNRLQKTSVTVHDVGLIEKQTHRDGYGRVVRVSEQIEPGSSLIHSTFEYDEANRLTNVCIGDDTHPNNNCQGQGRAMNYDGRGFLTSKSYPELDGSITYKYDAMGNVTERIHGGSFDLSYTYDRATRMTQVRDGNGLMLQEFFYGRTNVGDNLRAGKLVLTKQHNRIPIPGSQNPVDVIISSSYQYEDVQGRISDFGIQSSTGPVFHMAIHEYGPFNNFLSFSYPTCIGPPCEDLGPNRDLVYEYYRDGTQQSVPGFIDNIRYHSNGFLKELQHANGVLEQIVLDPLDNTRFEAFQTQNLNVPGENWYYGPFQYDQANNITAIGPATFSYDGVFRLKTSHLETGDSQDLKYDLFGNITQFTENGNTRTLAVDPARNRLSGASFAYDIAGNMTRITLAGVDFQITFDPLNRLSTKNSNGKTISYAYTATGERVATFDLDGTETWTPRDPSGSLLRRFRRDAQGWSWQKDTIYANDRQVATVTSENNRHLHLDHLKSTRQITDSDGNQVAFFDNLPFGKTVEDHPPETEELQFTGHERDRWEDNAPETDLDYMLARFYSPHLGRFLSTDQEGGKTGSSQTWNRYTYVANNPISKLDPDGKSAKSVHAGHTRLVMKPKGFSPSAINYVIKYNLRSDKYLRRIITPGHATALFHPGRLANLRGRAFARWKLNRAIRFVKQNKLLKGLRALGRALHAAEDAVAHDGLGNLSHTVLEWAFGPGNAWPAITIAIIPCLCI